MLTHRARYLAGILLILAGVVFLLEAVGAIPSGFALLWILLFAGAGFFFLYLFVSNRRGYWWAAIPGFITLGIASVIGLNEYLPGVGDDIGGASFLAAIGLGFWVVYIANTLFWWAIIPAGVLTTLALIAGFNGYMPEQALGGAFFLGIGVTFGLVYLLPNPGERMTWALWPASVLVIIGLIVASSAVETLNYLWPTTLILAGLYLVYRTVVVRRG